MTMRSSGGGRDEHDLERRWPADIAAYDRGPGGDPDDGEHPSGIVHRFPARFS